MRERALVIEIKLSSRKSQLFLWTPFGGKKLPLFLRTDRVDCFLFVFLLVFAKFKFAAKREKEETWRKH